MAHLVAGVAQGAHANTVQHDIAYYGYNMVYDWWAPHVLHV